MLHWSGTRIIYSLATANTPQIEALYELLDKCCPDDEVMQADLARLTEAVKNGSCRLDPYPPGQEILAFGNASYAQQMR
jgi:hypothetical protein